MPDSVIQIENLWKKYRLGAIGTGMLAHDLNRWWHRLLSKPDPYLVIDTTNQEPRTKNAEHRTANQELRTRNSELGTKNQEPRTKNPDELWALRNLSFTVSAGEVLGLIGRNGAGKSTLLKILSRVTAPTHGEVRIRGRIASLLEVGTGFHPELTGRENIFLNGAILGMTKAEIRGKLDEIIAFAEIAQFADTPVKRYSSGMYVRLAFAIAAHLEPDILIVDEVLAVGDVEFQQKCIAKMKEVATCHGRTILLVSHNPATIRALCTRALVLSAGAITFDGPVPDALHHYPVPADAPALVDT